MSSYNSPHAYYPHDNTIINISGSDNTTNINTTTINSTSVDQDIHYYEDGTHYDRRNSHANCNNYNVGNGIGRNIIDNNRHESIRDCNESIRNVLQGRLNRSDNSCRLDVNSQILVGVGAPANSCGTSGDIYIDKCTRDYYTNRNRIWVFVGNLECREQIYGTGGCKGEKGIKGELGPKGNTGQKGDIGSKGDRGDKGEPTISMFSYINSYEQSVPGGFTSVVPSKATIAYISCVGGGGGGSSGSGNSGFHGGGAGGSVIKYPVSVVENQAIRGTVGAGGSGGQVGTLGMCGTDTVVTIGTLTITAKAGLSPTETSGGDGGTVIFAQGMFSPAIAKGGTISSPSGSNGNVGFFAFSGAGGGFRGGNGGNILAFNGGKSQGPDTAGGGGASAFADGGYIAVRGCVTASKGSGGGGAIQTGPVSISGVAGNGGNGYVRIDYYSQ